MLENVTVIIPAHNRPERLRRLLDYYSVTDIRILIPDSSVERYTGPTDSPRIIYKHFPRMHFLLKIREVLPLISTPYVLYCADDDFAVPAGIARVTEFLDANPDYSIAQGHYLTFIPDGNGCVSFYPRYIRNFNNRITGATPLERLAAEKGMYASMLYGVSRTEVFRKIYGYCFSEAEELRFKNLFLAEEFFNHAMLIQGRYATIPCFFSARERIKGSATETTVSLAVIKNAPEYRDEFDGFIHSLATMLADATGMPVEEAASHIRRLSKAPIDTRSITIKRKFNSFFARHRLFGWASRLSDWRYHQKGLKAVKGMPSYPCTTRTPDIDAIIRAVNSN